MTGLHASRRELRRQAAGALLGRVFKDKWRLVRLLGLGGTGAVYEAVHRNGARVAIKVLHGDLAGDPSLKRRLLREGHAANAIQHPGVVFIHDDDIDHDGSVFLVMELLQGESLQSKLDKAGRGLPLSQVVPWAKELLEILAAAHDRGVLHRDLKPSNLFVTSRGELKVLDFGLARQSFALEPASTSTESGVLLGTPAFTSPEQARGRWELVDPRSDLWSAGATLFTLLSAQHVHQGVTGQEQLGMAMTVSARSLRSANPSLPAELVAWVDRALEFEPSERWQSARDMARALPSPLSGAEAPAHLESSPPLENAFVSDQDTAASTASTMDALRGEIPQRRRATRQWRAPGRSVVSFGIVAIVAAMLLAFSRDRRVKHADSSSDSRAPGSPIAERASAPRIELADENPSPAVAPSTAQRAAERDPGSLGQLPRRAPQARTVTAAPSASIQAPTNLLDRTELLERK